jgi:hypothetical protein
MSFCPNKSSSQYKTLVSQLGEIDAYNAWYLKNKALLSDTPMSTKPRVQELFDSNPELAKIGTLQLYSQYLDSIFPNSQVKDIVYHKTSSKEIEGGKFKISRLGGVYFSFFNVPSGSLLKGLFQKIIKENTIIAVVDVKNPFIIFLTHKLFHHLIIYKLQKIIDYLNFNFIPNSR